ncbi:hypothetical protein BY996DRAFT_6420935 [Phakopsora pachyrhizi]|uniref:Expressed protein n=1 Tax=Phakopsora pachyrhizi TaxID=170000 RepID=A0AAV0BMI4_PHAPC|nr:hypothetical protein BY996DRAFT_6428481 [Phakopsora pachyrhizi]KAI8447509.1 hypothetical protein BY996DRAFT_6420935 [Phakopsora pachyrhizi]CAH7687843.1 expressed protein [Phakopsora pachyrhizi]
MTFRKKKFAAIALEFLIVQNFVLMIYSMFERFEVANPHALYHDRAVDPRVAIDAQRNIRPYSTRDPIADNFRDYQVSTSNSGLGLGLEKSKLKPLESQYGVNPSERATYFSTARRPQSDLVSPHSSSGLSSYHLHQELEKRPLPINFEAFHQTVNSPSYHKSTVMSGDNYRYHLKNKSPQLSSKPPASDRNLGHSQSTYNYGKTSKTTSKSPSDYIEYVANQHESNMRRLGSTSHFSQRPNDQLRRGSHKSNLKSTITPYRRGDYERFLPYKLDTTSKGQGPKIRNIPARDYLLEFKGNRNHLRKTSVKSNNSPSDHVGNVAEVDISRSTSSSSTERKSNTGQTQNPRTNSSPHLIDAEKSSSPHKGSQPIEVNGYKPPKKLDPEPKGQESQVENLPVQGKKLQPLDNPNGNAEMISDPPVHIPQSLSSPELIKEDTKFLPAENFVPKYHSGYLEKHAQSQAMINNEKGKSNKAVLKPKALRFGDSSYKNLEELFSPKITHSSHPENEQLMVSELVSQKIPVEKLAGPQGKGSIRVLGKDIEIIPSKQKNEAPGRSPIEPGLTDSHKAPESNAQEAHDTFKLMGKTFLIPSSSTGNNDRVSASLLPVPAVEVELGTSKKIMPIQEIQLSQNPEYHPIGSESSPVGSPMNKEKNLVMYKGESRAHNNQKLSAVQSGSHPDLSAHHRESSEDASSSIQSSREAIKTNELPPRKRHPNINFLSSPDEVSLAGFSKVEPEAAAGLSKLVRTENLESESGSKVMEPFDMIRAENNLEAPPGFGGKVFSSKENRSTGTVIENDKPRRPASKKIKAISAKNEGVGGENSENNQYAQSKRKLIGSDDFVWNSRRLRSSKRLNKGQSNSNNFIEQHMKFNYKAPWNE